jgi:hypothetical protein
MICAKLGLSAPALGRVAITETRCRMPNIFEQLALLSDAEVHNALGRLIEGYAERNRNIPVQDAGALGSVLKQLAGSLGESITPRSDSELRDRARAERTILVHLTRNTKQRKFVQAAIDSRPVLLEPITVALIMAGIILVLETEFDIKISKKNGKRDYDVRIGKKPTDKSLIKDLFSIIKPS